MGVRMDRMKRDLGLYKLGSMALVLLVLFCSSVSEGMDPPSQRSRAFSGSKKVAQADCDSGCPKSLPDYLVEDNQVEKARKNAGSPFRGATNCLKDVYDGLVTSKELLKVMGRVCRIDQQSSTTVSLFSALKLELDRACVNVGKLIVERSSSHSDVEVLLKHFEKEKAVWRLKEQEKIRGAVKSVAGELEIEKKLRRQTERLNKKLGRELADTKAALSKANNEIENEKRTREILEQVCDELARGIGEDRAEVEELMKQFGEVQEAVEKEREMFQVADVLREERVHMKLSEAKYQFEEKHALVDRMRNELESYLKSKRGDEQPDCFGSPRYEKIKELQIYLRETLPCSYQYGHNKNEDVNPVNDDNIDADGDESAETDLHSIELNMDDTSKSFQWSDIVRSEANRNPNSKRRIVRKPSRSSGTNYTKDVEWEVASDKQESIEMFDVKRVFTFGSSQPWKRDVEDELQRYNMIKDLRDHIVSGSRTELSQELKGPEEHFGQPSVASNDPNEAMKTLYVKCLRA